MKKLGCTAQANIPISQFSIFSMNWEKLRVPAKATFRNPNFQSFCEMGKTWQYNLSPKFISPNFESIDELRKVMF